MKRMSVLLYATGLALALAIGAGYAGETQVVVDKGKVEVSTDKGTTTVEAGHKAVVTEGKETQEYAEDPMVQDLLTLTQWAAADKATCSGTASGVSIMIHSLESDTVIKYAALCQLRNVSAKETDTERWGPTTVSSEARYYDMDGSLLPTRFEKIDGAQNGVGYLYITHSKVTAPNDLFPQVITVAESPVSTMGDALVHTGSIWQLSLGNETQYWLNYYEVILPESAILVDWNMPVVTTFSRGDRTVVVMRNLTGKQARGRYALSFVWPKKDGTSLKDVPAGYFTSLGILGKIAAAQDVTLDAYAERMKREKAAEPTKADNKAEEKPADKPADAGAASGESRADQKQ